jgi:hypothetical protein
MAELPRFNQNYHMKKYTFSYGVGFVDEKALIFDAIIKTNMTTGIFFEGRF